MARTPSRRAFRQMNPTRNEQDGDFQEIMADVRGHMPGGTQELIRLADEAGLASSTVKRLGDGETDSPHFSTIVRVMKAVGKLDVLMNALRSEKPVSIKAAQSRKSARAKLKQKHIDKVHPHRVSKVPVRASQQRASVH